MVYCDPDNQTSIRPDIAAVAILTARAIETVPGLIKDVNRPRVSALQVSDVALPRRKLRYLLQNLPPFVLGASSGADLHWAAKTMLRNNTFIRLERF